MTADRITRYAQITVVVYALSIFGFAIAQEVFGLFPTVTRIGPDFLVFYTGGIAAWQGEATLAYDLHYMSAMYRTIFPSFDDILGWYYPPTYFLPCLFLPLLPYDLAYALWCLVSAALFALAIRPYLSFMPQLGWLIAAWPVLYFNINLGQNGFFTAALFILGTTQARHRPLLAGLALGLLTMKPHLGLLIPLYLLMIGAWRTIGVATITALSLILCSVLAFGVEPWRVFFTDNVALVESLLDARAFPLTIMSSPYATALGLGVSSSLAKGLHVAWLLLAFAGLLALWRQGAARLWLIGYIAVITVTLSPYGFLYDWTLLVFPCLLLVQYAARHGWTHRLRLVAILTLFLPLVMINLPVESRVSFGVFVPLLLAWTLYRLAPRRRRPSRSGRMAPAVTPAPAP